MIMLLSIHDIGYRGIILHRLVQFLLWLVLSSITLSSSRSCTLTPLITANVIVVKIVIVAGVIGITDIVTI